MSSPRYLVVALYKFVALPDYRELQQPILDKCLQHDILGTLLLADEGINGTISGTRGDVDTLLDWLHSDARFSERFSDIEHKESFASEKPFQRMKVKLKQEIVTMGIPDIDPVEMAGTYVAPEQWNELITDPDVVVIDTRNDYEVGIGKFRNAVNPETKSFRDFPEWVRTQSALREKPKVAMYCTGGIRCEKSTALLKSMGFENVFHLQGGILKYLETVPEKDSLWEGECFVFDERVAVGHGLKPGTHSICRACGMPLSKAEMESPDYIVDEQCPHCLAGHGN